jgi:hypothetical protein
MKKQSTKPHSKEQRSAAAQALGRTRWRGISAKERSEFAR